MNAPSVTLAVLGPLQAMVGGTVADLGGPRPRAVLARLIAAGAAVVSTDRLIDDLWEAEEPARALAALQVHISGLRRALEPERRPRAPATVLVSAAPGYALRLPDDGCDAWRFVQLIGQATAQADPRLRHEQLTQALACWTGPAYAEFADQSWAIPEIARLNELRLTAMESRAEAELSLSRPETAVPDLDRLVREHPARENAVRLLALALYRSGRQGDALATLRTARHHLAEELGIDPGPALRALETGSLSQDPGADPGR